MDQLSDLERKVKAVIESSISAPANPTPVLSALDSIDLMELSMAIEIHFGVELTGVEIAGLENVKALASFIESAS